MHLTPTREARHPTSMNKYNKNETDSEQENHLKIILEY